MLESGVTTTMTEQMGHEDSSPVYVCSQVARTVANVDRSLHKQYDSPFFRLPAELRNMVYFYTLGGHIWTISMSGGKNKARADNAIEHSLALLRVNRQIYAEACFFPYLYSTFAGRHNGHLGEWVQSLSNEQRASITSIKCDRRGHIVKGPLDFDVSPTFWMDVPHMLHWNLSGLRKIEVEVALSTWGCWGVDEGAEAAKLKVLARLRKLVEEEHPGVVVDAVLRRGF